MNATAIPSPTVRARNMLFFAQPDLWPSWPFLPLVKRLADQPELCGVLFDAMGCAQLPGYSSTVFMTNLFLMPRQIDEFLGLAKEMFDTREELADAGWCVD
jgi:hypothetical protein